MQKSLDQSDLTGMGRFCHVLSLLFLFPLSTCILPCFCQKSTLSCRGDERDALIELKQSPFDPLGLLSSWEGKDCCHWNRVTCYAVSGHVFKLELMPYSRETTSPTIDPDKPFSAIKLWSCLLKLRYLSHLDLSRLELTGPTPFPEFLGSMRQLKFLNLSNVGFQGRFLQHLRNLTNLEVLDIQNPDLFVGSDDHWVSHLTALKYLDLSSLSLAKARDLMQLLGMLPSLSHLALSSCGLRSLNLSKSLLNSSFLANIQYLDLSSNGIQGTLPSAFHNMTSLRYLDLSDNSFHSSVRIWFSNFKNLFYLDLENNAFESIEGGFSSLVGNLCHIRFLNLASNLFQGEMIGNSTGFCAFNLESLTVSGNNFKGEVLDWLGSLTVLRYLSLDHNSFTGPIPITLGTWNRLTELDLSGNKLYGAIPTSLEQLQSLRRLDLQGNLFNCTIPESIGQLSQLEILDLSDNSFEGIVSEAHFTNLSRLTDLDISNNQLTIKINSDWSPPFRLAYVGMGSCRFNNRFPGWIRSQKEAYQLVLSNTSISGDMPEWLGTELSLQYLNLSHNQITGQIPSFSSNIDGLDLSHNQISGSIPTFSLQNFYLFYLDLSHNLLSEPIPPDYGEKMLLLEYLLLNENHITGPIPSSLCNMGSPLALDLSRNKLLGNIPNCWEKPSFLRLISFSSNNLFGVIPSSIGNQSSLTSLHLNNNSLHGMLPSSLMNLLGLEILDLGENHFSGDIPLWIGQKLKLLRILRLRQNHFSGALPAQLCELSQLQILDLSVNNLEGTIPHCFGSISGMTRASSSMEASNALTLDFDSLGIADPPNNWSQERLVDIIKGEELKYTTTLNLVVALDLSSNKLLGPIPEELTLLSGLLSLNLSYNLLSGSMLETIGDMSSLESLDLSNNQLSGKIPPSISDLTYLSHLNLSNNNFGGEVPRGTQLDTLYGSDNSIYAGNRFLCGELLPNKCQGKDAPQSSKTFSKKEGIGKPDSGEKFLLYGVIAVGFATGFWGVFGLLALKKSWRDAYFMFAEEIADRAYVAVKVKATKLKRRIRSN